MLNKLRNLIKAETKRQQETIGLIASENVVYPEVLEVLGTPLVNKYSEGYPGKRYYPGNEYYDEIENLAKEEGLKAFGLNSKEWFANVQSYSGSPANAAIYFALANPGDTIMGMSLASGGHLTHGHNMNFSSRFYKPVQYGIDMKTGLIDYEEIERLAEEHKPKIIYSGTSSYSRIVDFKRIGEIAKKVGAYHVADISHIAGLVVGGAHPAPFGYADVVMTTTHKTLRGPRGAIIFSRGEDIAKKIDQAIMPGLQGGPHNNQTAAIALIFDLVQKDSFKEYASQVVKNAKVLAEQMESYGFEIFSGGTDTHLMLIDLKNKNLSGIEAEKLLESAGIVVNRNSIPGDEHPFNPSGLRIGTPLLTARGMKENEMKDVATFIHRVIDLKEPTDSIKKEVVELCNKFLLPYK